MVTGIWKSYCLKILDEKIKYGKSLTYKSVDRIV